MPSSDDEYEDDEMPTPKAVLAELPALTPSALGTPNLGCASDASTEGTPKTSSLTVSSKDTLDTGSIESSASKCASTQGKDPSQLLSDLRQCFQRDEQALYSQLSKARTSSLNDVRRDFRTTSRSAIRRLYAWELKHVPEQRNRKRGKFANFIETIEPEWWKEECHAVPGGSVIVRETEWASLIAFTLRYGPIAELRIHY